MLLLECFVTKETVNCKELQLLPLPTCFSKAAEATMYRQLPLKMGKKTAMNKHKECHSKVAENECSRTPLYCTYEEL